MDEDGRNGRGQRSSKDASAFIGDHFVHRRPFRPSSVMEFLFLKKPAAAK
jgi:hypothetical protein